MSVSVSMEPPASASGALVTMTVTHCAGQDTESLIRAWPPCPEDGLELAGPSCSSALCPLLVPGLPPSLPP